jgi:hypothetical protein
LRIDVRTALPIVAVLLSHAMPAWSDPRQDYVLNCMGCHLADGTGKPPAVPRLKDRVGYYLTIPGGRAYLAQVPGAANSLLDDRQLTGVLNWIVDEFAGASQPSRFQRFEVEEVATYRRTRPDDIDALRHALRSDIARAYPQAGNW